MTSRQNLSEQTVRSRDSLITALRTSSGNTELIALRARHLLRCKPSGDDRDAWLRTVLPNGDTAKVLKALRTVNGGTPAKGASGNGQPAADTDEDNNGGGSRQHRGRRPQRRRRT